MRFSSSLSASFFVTLILASSLSFAQDSTVSNAAPAAAPLSEAQAAAPAVQAAPTSSATELTPEQKILAAIEKELKQKLAQDIYVPPSISSLVFAANQYSLLREARQGFNARVPSQAELEAERDVALTTDDVVLDDKKNPVTPSVREIQLGGIVFITPDEWTIWLNKQRITPTTIPSQATDLRVYREFVELRWLDQATNQVFPIRLRPNQRFNLDSKVFLPGQTENILTGKPEDGEPKT
jgi:hypothetical protein